MLVSLKQSHQVVVMSVTCNNALVSSLLSFFAASTVLF